MVDWKYYLKDVHTPAVTQSLRELSSATARSPTVQIRERDEPVVAVFDMEGTIITSNVVESYVWTRMADLEPDEWPPELVSVFASIPGYLQIDRRDRGDFLRTFFRRYEGASVEGIDRIVQHHVGEFMLQKASAAAIRRVREHRAAGHRTILITAAAEPFIRTLAPLFDIVIGAELAGEGGPLHGVHVGPAAGGRGARRVAQALRHAGERGPEALLRVRGLVQRPAAAPRGGPPRGGLARRLALPVRAPPPVAHRGVGHDEGHAARAVPESPRPDADACPDGAGARAVPQRARAT